MIKVVIAVLFWRRRLKDKDNKGTEISPRAALGFRQVKRDNFVNFSAKYASDIATA
ncbi:MAG TPA: hypothetical protein H9729_06590 [Candidatus Borkfalkia excrementigallinarum]|uniref:Uncharacterized protein n=1 Tax=Candidatus Borkfalkia excrementigallinarum TaxID=2838506 RepID=A0A9D1ZX35_9FIRM|nr:hypothetical protein [Candidatus Borkfalkia excrementigallinarum]